MSGLPQPDHRPFSLEPGGRPPLTPVGVRPVGLGVVAAAALALTAIAAAVLTSNPPGPRTSLPSAASPGTPSATASSVASASLGATPSPSTVVGGRYDDGLPRSLGGQPVLRGDAALAHAADARDATPFLITGWVTWDRVPISCPPFLSPGPGSLLRRCGDPVFADTAGAEGGVMNAAVSFALLRPRPTTGPYVFRVHVHDPRASECGSAAALCDRLMVADQILWSGDAATDPRPFSAEEVRAALHSTDSALVMTRIGGDVFPLDCGQTIPAAVAYNVTDAATRTPTVTGIYVSPTPGALRHALAGPPEGSLYKQPVCTECTSAGSLTTSAAYRWLVVGNVALLVRGSIVLSAADAAYAACLLSALRAEGSGSTVAPSTIARTSAWRLVALPAAPGTAVLVSSVVAVPNGFVAVGDVVGGDVVGSPGTPMAWSSPDGERWTAEPMGGQASPATAIAWGERVLVLGGTGLETRCAHPSAFASWVRDGQGAWTAAPFDELFCAGPTSTGAVLGNRAVAVGLGTGDVPITWETADGLRWTDAHAWSPDETYLTTSQRARQASSPSARTRPASGRRAVPTASPGLLGSG